MFSISRCVLGLFLGSVIGIFVRKESPKLLYLLSSMAGSLVGILIVKEWNLPMYICLGFGLALTAYAPSLKTEGTIN
jgi:hypothetical protein